MIQCIKCNISDINSTLKSDYLLINTWKNLMFIFSNLTRKTFYMNSYVFSREHITYTHIRTFHTSQSSFIPYTNLFFTESFFLRHTLHTRFCFIGNICDSVEFWGSREGSPGVVVVRHTGEAGRGVISPKSTNSGSVGFCLMKAGGWGFTGATGGAGGVLLVKTVKT